MRTMLRAAALCLAFANVCHASLGGAPSIGNPNPSQPAAAVKKFAAGDYTTVETTLATGTRVREYVSPAGRVFAVSWSGPVMPNLKELLGQYFETLTSASANRPAAGHSQLIIKQPDVVIQSGGHMRALEGRAWIPDQLPQGFAISDIQ